jgi:hypothetical protein
MNSLEMDREVIRCKTCGLVQYRTRTDNCRRCVRALPQRLEFLIPPAAPLEEAVAEPTSNKFANQETVENIGQRIRQLRESRNERHRWGSLKRFRSARRLRRQEVFAVADDARERLAAAIGRMALVQVLQQPGKRRPVRMPPAAGTSP